MLAPKLPALPQTLGICFPQDRPAVEEDADSPGVHPIPADPEDKPRNSMAFFFNKHNLSLWKDLPYRDLSCSLSLFSLKGVSQLSLKQEV